MRSASSLSFFAGFIGFQFFLAACTTAPSAPKPNGGGAPTNGTTHHIHITGNEGTSDDDSGGGDTTLTVSKDDRIKWIDDDASHDYFVCFGLKNPSDPTQQPFHKHTWRVSKSHPANSGPLRTDAVPPAPHVPYVNVYYDVYQVRPGKPDCTPPDIGTKGNPKIVIQQ